MKVKRIATAVAVFATVVVLLLLAPPALSKHNHGTTKLAPEVNVTDYGAIPNDGKDDTAAFMRALVASPRVFVPCYDALGKPALYNVDCLMDLVAKESSHFRSAPSCGIIVQDWDVPFDWEHAAPHFEYVLLVAPGPVAFETPHNFCRDCHPDGDPEGEGCSRPDLWPTITASP